MCIYGCVYSVSAVGILYKQPSGTDHGNFLQSYQNKLVWNFMQMVDCMRTACCMQAEGLGGFRFALWVSLAADANWTPPFTKTYPCV